MIIWLKEAPQVNWGAARWHIPYDPSGNKYSWTEPVAMLTPASVRTATLTAAWVRDLNKAIDSLLLEPSGRRSEPRTSPPGRWKPGVESDLGHRQQPPVKHWGLFMYRSPEEHCTSPLPPPHLHCDIRDHNNNANAPLQQYFLSFSKALMKM